MNSKNTLKIHLKPIEKYVFKPTIWIKNLTKLICNKLGHEGQPMF
jgi:hypothetical protein